jgi:hypothetical protein
MRHLISLTVRHPMKFKQFLFGICVLGSTLSLTACASLFGDKGRTVQITSKPEGAKVYHNGDYIGKTPVALDIANPMDSNVVRVEKPGYRPFEKPVQTSFQSIGVLNILFWPGFIVDYATGDMKKVNPNLSFALISE